MGKPSRTIKFIMKVGIHLDRYNILSKYTKVYFDILAYNSIEAIPLSTWDKDFFQKIKTVDYFIYRWYHYDYDRQMALTIIPIVENELQIPCFPNLATCWHFDDKIKQYYVSVAQNLPMTESYVFWNKKDAKAWIDDATFPVIFKLKGGAGSQNVSLIKKKSQAIRLTKRLFGSGIKEMSLFDSGSTSFKDFNIYKKIKNLAWHLKMRSKGQPVETNYTPQKNYILFQKYLPNNQFDTRITIIGNRAFAFRRFNRKNDFRSSGSGMIDYNKEEISLEHVKTAFTVSKKMKFQCMAYDFLYNENGGSEFCEMCYTFVDKAVYKCNGYWDDSLNWHEGHYWPQFCQLQDLLQMPELKQPIID